jgi:predicted ferric reductase
MALGVDFQNDVNGQIFPVILPNVLVQGPFHSYPKTLLNNIQTADSIIIANGIGLTTFAYLLSQIETLPKFTTTLDILFIVKHSKEIDWLLPILNSLSTKFPSIHITISCTQNADHTGGNISYIIGRPNVTSFFHSHYISKSVLQNSITKVYYSGTQNLFNDLENVIRSYKQFYDLVKL